MSGLQVVTDGPQLPPPSLEEVEGLRATSPATPISTTPLADTLSQLGIRVIPTEIAEAHKKKLASFFNPAFAHYDGWQKEGLTSLLAFSILAVIAAAVTGPVMGWIPRVSLVVLALALSGAAALFTPREWSRQPLQLYFGLNHIPKRFRQPVIDIYLKHDPDFWIERLPVMDPLLWVGLGDEEYCIGSWGLLKCEGRLAKLLPPHRAK